MPVTAGTAAIHNITLVIVCEKMTRNKQTHTDQTTMGYLNTHKHTFTHTKHTSIRIYT